MSASWVSITKKAIKHVFRVIQNLCLIPLEAKRKRKKHPVGATYLKLLNRLCNTAINRTIHRLGVKNVPKCSAGSGSMPPTGKWRAGPLQ